MTDLSVSKPARFHHRNGALRRALLAGGAWGLGLAAGLAGLSIVQCGGVCLPDLAVTAALSIAAGVVTIGPFAAFGPPRRSDAAR